MLTRNETALLALESERKKKSLQLEGKKHDKVSYASPVAPLKLGEEFFPNLLNIFCFLFFFLPTFWKNPGRL